MASQGAISTLLLHFAGRFLLTMAFAAQVWHTLRSAGRCLLEFAKSHIITAHSLKARMTKGVLAIASISN